MTKLENHKKVSLPIEDDGDKGVLVWLKPGWCYDGEYGLHVKSFDNEKGALKELNYVGSCRCADCEAQSSKD